MFPAAPFTSWGAAPCVRATCDVSVRASQWTVLLTCLSKDACYTMVLHLDTKIEQVSSGHEKKAEPKANMQHQCLQWLGLGVMADCDPDLPFSTVAFWFTAQQVS